MKRSVRTTATLLAALLLSAVTAVSGASASSTAMTAGKTSAVSNPRPLNTGTMSPNEGPYRVGNKGSGKCLNIPGGSTETNAPVTQFTCGNWEDHYWYWENAHNTDFVWLRNSHSGKCLSNAGDNRAGAPMVQAPCAYESKMLWLWEQYPDLKLQIRNRNTGMCLAVSGGSKADNAQVIQWPCGAFDDHFWYVMG
jgi:hypothetical protein